MSNKQKYTWIGIIVAVVVVVLIVWLVTKNNKPASPAVMTPTPTPQTATPAPTPSPGTPAADAAAYAAALAKYGNYRIQIQPSCQVVPNTVSYKTGTTIMLDNRSATSHTLKLDTTYVIGAYDFKIVTLSSTKLPHTILMDCDKSQNVASITLEK